ncbi:MAG: hypothetical protein V9G10_03125 [Candidatus Nanopelagicales bacterium]
MTAVALHGRHKKAAAGQTAGVRRPVAERRDRNVGVLDLTQLVCRRPVDVGQQIGGDVGGRGQQYSIGAMCAVAAAAVAHDHIPTISAVPQALHDGPRADRHAVLLQCGGQFRCESAYAALDADEQRSPARTGGLAAVLEHGPGGIQRRTPAARQPGREQGTVGLQAQVLGTPRIHPAQHRLHQAGGDVGAEPRGHVVTDRDVAVQHCARQQVIKRDAQQGGQRQDPAGRQPAQIGGHAGQRGARHRPQLTARVDRSGRRSGRLQVQAQFPAQVDGLRAGGQHRLGAGIDAYSADLFDAQFAAHAGRGFEHGHGGTRALDPVGQEPGGGQAADPAADDDDVRQPSR